MNVYIVTQSLVDSVLYSTDTHTHTHTHTHTLMWMCRVIYAIFLK